MKLSQIRLIVNDYHQSVAFYKEVMEFPLGVAAEEMQFASFSTGDTKIEIFARQKMVEEIGEDKIPIDAKSPSKFLLAFAVDEVDEVCSRLKEKGVVLINEPHDRKDWNARVVHFRDPDGNVIEIYKHPL